MGEMSLPVAETSNRPTAATLLVALSCLLTGCAQPGQPGTPLDQIGQGFMQGMRNSGFGPPGAGGGSPGVESAGLKNIMPRYDPDKPLSQQFPHVAVTVLHAPPNWMGPAMQNDPLSGGFSNIRGCWTMTAVVWSSETNSRRVGPFDWCNPRDAQISLGPQAGMGMLKSQDLSYSTGIRRTDGPRPPSTLFPEDRHDFKSGIAPSVRLSQFTGSALWLMYGNLIYAMGSSPGQWGDYRIWIVTIDG